MLNDNSATAPTTLPVPVQPRRVLAPNFLSQPEATVASRPDGSLRIHRGTPDPPDNQGPRIDTALEVRIHMPPATSAPIPAATRNTADSGKTRAADPPIVLHPQTTDDAPPSIRRGESEGETPAGLAPAPQNLNPLPAHKDQLATAGAVHSSQPVSPAQPAPIQSVQQGPSASAQAINPPTAPNPPISNQSQEHPQALPEKPQTPSTESIWANPSRELPQQPVRSVALEFTPDGLSDVRLRLSERAGDVHISVHSNNPTVHSTLQDGIHSLVGTLSHAGYDATAWTPGQSRENPQRRQDATPNPRRKDTPGAGAEDFGGYLTNPSQEHPR